MYNKNIKGHFSSKKINEKQQLKCWQISCKDSPAQCFLPQIIRNTQRHFLLQRASSWGCGVAISSFPWRAQKSQEVVGGGCSRKTNWRGSEKPPRLSLSFTGGGARTVCWQTATMGLPKRKLWHIVETHISHKQDQETVALIVSEFPVSAK